MNIRFLVFLMFLFFNPAFSQNLKPELDTYAPVSPNAASLGKYGLFPVNYNLGTVNTGIPIYTINTGQQELPINLSYNTGGIRVNELASWVGLGWSLNSGGAIIRNTKGIPENISSTTEIKDLQNAAYNQVNYEYLYGVWSGQKDSQTDEFIINAPGITGTFYFDFSNSNDIVFSDHTKAKVNILSGTEIEVVRTDGTTLRFGTAIDNHDATEVSTMPASNHRNAYDYISAWYLTEMISPKGDTITFKYKSKDYVWDYPVASGENVIQPESSGPLKGTYPDVRHSDKKYLERIEFKNGYLLFNSTLGRQDLNDEYRLDNIKVYSGNFGGSNVVLVEEYTFNYTYFTRSGGTLPTGHFGMQGGRSFTDTNMVNSRTKSLKLDKVIVGKNGVGQEYFFEYDSTVLPLRGSTSQDQWGYANANTGSLLLPTSGTFSTTSSLGSLGSPINYNVGTGDRNGNEAKMKAASLKKITYPTGGYTVFEYDTYKNTYQTTEPTYSNKNEAIQAYGTDCDPNTYPATSSSTFSIGSNYVVGSGKLYITFSESSGQGNGFTHVEHNNVVYSGPTNGSTSSSSQVVNVNFSQGFHTLEAYEYRSGNTNSAQGCAFTTISASWQVDNGATTTTTHVDVYGGLRVKSIKNYDGVSASPVTIKEFEYEGVNVLQPKKIRGETSFFLNNSRQLNVLVSTNVGYDNNIGGRPVLEYGKVTEYDISPVDANNNGKSVYHYNTIPSQRLLEFGGPIAFKHPQLDITGVEEYGLLNTIYNNALNTDTFSFFRTDKWRYGTLGKKEIYKNTGTTQNPVYVKVSQTENQYATLQTSDIKINFISKIWMNEANNDGVWYDPDSYEVYGYNNYHFSYFIGEVSLGKQALSQTITTNYDTNGNNPIVQTINYFYENSDHLQPTKIETTNSKGELLKTATSYAHDVSDQTLINQNRIAEPVQIESFKKVGTDPETKLIEQKTLYNTFGSNYLPNKIQTSKGIASLEDHIQFHDYYSNGNVKEVSKDNGTHIIYVWGYNEQYPIAKIENATFTGLPSNIQVIIDAAVLASDNDINTTTENTLRTSLDNLRIQFPNAMVSTYTYDPLIGVTSMTDPKGYTMYYEYDDFNRLEQVKDAEGKILSKNKYHYKGQQ